MFRNCSKQSDMAAKHKRLDSDKFIYPTGNIHSFFSSANIKMAVNRGWGWESFAKKMDRKWWDFVNSKHSWKRWGVKGRGEKENSYEKGGMGGYLRNVKLVIILSLSLSHFKVSFFQICSLSKSMLIVI